MEYYGISYDNIHNNINYVKDTQGHNTPIMTCEELAECIKAISKMERSCGYSCKNKENLISEIGDVYISLYAIMEYYNIQDIEVEEYMNNKLTHYNAIDKNFIEDMRDIMINELNVEYTERGINCLLRANLTTADRFADRIATPKWWETVRNLGERTAKILEEAFSIYCERN